MFFRWMLWCWIVDVSNVYVLIRNFKMYAFFSILQLTCILSDLLSRNVSHHYLCLNKTKNSSSDIFSRFSEVRGLRNREKFQHKNLTTRHNSRPWHTSVVPSTTPFRSFHFPPTNRTCQNRKFHATWTPQCTMERARGARRGGARIGGARRAAFQFSGIRTNFTRKHESNSRFCCGVSRRRRWADAWLSIRWRFHVCTTQHTTHKYARAVVPRSGMRAARMGAAAHGGADGFGEGWGPALGGGRRAIDMGRARGESSQIEWGAVCGTNVRADRRLPINCGCLTFERRAARQECGLFAVLPTGKMCRTRSYAVLTFGF